MSKTTDGRRAEELPGKLNFKTSIIPLILGAVGQPYHGPNRDIVDLYPVLVLLAKTLDRTNRAYKTGLQNQSSENQRNAKDNARAEDKSSRS